MEEQQPLSVTAARICRELENVFVTAEASGLDPRQTIVKEIMKTAKGRGHVVVHGVGREGLMMKGFAMRLFHLGLNTACVGDMTAPHVGPGDLLIASAGPGGFGSVNAIIARAKQDGARVLLLTAQPGGSAARLADVVAVVPAQTMAHDAGKTCASVLPMGSLYEGGLFLFFEMAILALAPALKQTAETMSSRHTNLE
ncbi:uncharacterized protein LOC131038189 [Cryptomeria japonica]|uniref:uncharacterized protein LOC131038189 n=1 Tax=Cryptomeria japonica TaxID=3369 RepID=UPI0027DA46A4|nr:uncharacterized protein LOC131038189 [Cryptomeria japonica]